MILGTHTSGGEQNHLMVAKVRLPKGDAELDVRQYDDERGELGGYGGDDWKIDVEIRINHPGEVNKARYCPHKPFLIGTKANSGEVLVFDYSKHESAPKDSLIRPQARLRGHDKVGYGISWSNLAPGKLLSGAEDGYLCIWDVPSLSNSGSKAPSASASSATAASSSAAAASHGPSAGFAECSVVDPVHKIAAHDGRCVNDVAWHRHNASIFGSVGDDRGLWLWDVRSADSTKGVPAVKVANAHADDVMSLAFNPFQEFLLITGGKDKLVKLWDSRTTRAPQHVFEGHDNAVGSVAFAPFDEAVLASAGDDRRVFIWDCGRIGEEQSDEDKADGPPELLVSICFPSPSPSSARTAPDGSPSPPSPLSPLPCSSSTAATRSACPTSAGASRTTGSCPPWRTTTSCRCGSWPATFTAAATTRTARRPRTAWAPVARTSTRTRMSSSTTARECDNQRILMQRNNTLQ